MRWALWALAALFVGSIAAVAATTPTESCLASFNTSLVGRTRSQRHNSDLAVRKLSGAVILPGEVFSFNRHVGTFSRDAGYRRAPVSYNGQLLDSWGGGVCQTSTTFYNAALLAGLEIVERNRHRFAPGYVTPGRDAAVAYDLIDLKVRNPYAVPLRIKGAIKGDRLWVAVFGEVRLQERPQVVQEVKQLREPATYTMYGKGRSGRIRNTGKYGCDVVTYRVVGGRRELLSTDSYPVMNRIVEHR